MRVLIKRVASPLQSTAAGATKQNPYHLINIAQILQESTLISLFSSKVAQIIPLVEFSQEAEAKPLLQDFPVSPRAVSHSPQPLVPPAPPAELQPRANGFSTAAGLPGGRARSTGMDPSWQGQPEHSPAHDPSWKGLPWITTSTTALQKLFGVV